MIVYWQLSPCVPLDSAFTLKHPDFLCKFFVLLWATRAAVALEPRRPPMTNVRTETAFRHDQRKHFRKSKPLLRLEVRWCDQDSIDLQLRRSTCLASRISTKKDPFLMSDFTPVLYLDILDADWSPNAADAQRSFPGRLIPMVKLKRIVKKVSKEKKNWKSSEICEKNWWICCWPRLRGCLSEICKREVSNLRNVRQGMWDAPTRTHRVYRVIVPVRWGDVWQDRWSLWSPQAFYVYERSRHRNCFPTRPAQAFQKK